MTTEERSTRDKILLAAMEMIGEDAGASLSVRAVAARAGVSTGSLRYFFPTQRELREAVMAGIYDAVATGDPIHDRSMSPRDRLAASLRQVLAPATVGDQARAAWIKVFEAFIRPDQTDEARARYQAFEREGQRRVESWLAVLAREGVLPEGDNTRRARFLNTVLNGLSIERALPADDTILKAETETLYAAVDAVLSGT
ncbi:TetR/AcrR family transcriptional regulator [Paractinoplanes ovalisporus]|uniref:TetR/AcrR family transcriptional regulator n=1 Tax=Paractinoplanes ovalisporus TaxID=2810368 RepID=UPI0027DD0BFF|nr:TetR/AcrR family transcriptional regulator [Actinoplanes ovalisporus]